MRQFFRLTVLFALTFAVACGSNAEPEPPIKPPVIKPDALTLVDARAGSQSDLESLTDVEPAEKIVLKFSEAIDPSTIDENISFRGAAEGELEVDLAYDSNQTIVVTPKKELSYFSGYTLTLGEGLSSAKGGKMEAEKAVSIATKIDMTDKFERISDEELLTLVQRRTFEYFWEFGHHKYGVTRERSTSGDIVTTGGTGFGVMAIIVGVERGFITREQGAARMRSILGFYLTTPNYHGALGHWYNGNTQQIVPFSSKDNGADLVETALLMQGLLAARAYFDGPSVDEGMVRDGITTLWRGIEWDFFTKEGAEKELYWHWSPTSNWAINLPIRGWNESLVVYLLAAASPTHAITKEVYDNGWAAGGAMRNGRSFYDTTLPLGPDMGGPLFFAHYSFMGLNPNGLSDGYANYWEQNVAHTTINHRYCKDNPKKFAGYSAQCWGLTASDGDNGYGAWSPSNDTGVIAPTAAIASMPYTPQESMAALHHFYYKLGDKLWGEYGFYDSFNVSKGWVDKDMYLAINQGPIIVMIENYRTGLLWDLFMSTDEAKRGMDVLGLKSSN